MSNISKYYHTIRYLKFKQIYHRFLFIFSKQKPDNRPAPNIRDFQGSFVCPARVPVSLVGPNTFLLLNKVANLSDCGWNCDNKKNSMSQLWRYNQHYFNDLKAIDSNDRVDWHKALMHSWVDKNRAGEGVGWASYPLSLRIVNWVKWSCAGNQLHKDCIQSLASQARWLMNSIEWHLLGNHLFSNAKALIYAGLFFSGKEADNWLNAGLSIIEQQLKEQILKDGGNFERSPMYHAIFLEDILDLINISNLYPDLISVKQNNELVKVSELMLQWQDGMLHPDGEIAFFNDAAIGVAPSPTELQSYAERLGINCFSSKRRLEHFIDSGYLRISQNDAVAIIDVAPVGPDYLPGHAHADTLSFELSLFGKRVIVNSGTSEYGTGEVRQSQRSTAAHNTVVVNNQNSSYVWGGFRVARRAYPKDLIINNKVEEVSISCAHDGYAHLAGKPIHIRKWTFLENSLMVEDKIDGDFECAYAYFHFHPDLVLYKKSTKNWTLRLSKEKSIKIHIEAKNVQLIDTYFAPEFGKIYKRKCLKVELDKIGSVARISWS